MALVNQNGSLVVRGGALGTGQDCCCDDGGPVDANCGIPIRTREQVVDGETVYVTQVFSGGAWITVVDPSVDFTDPSDIGYYCDPFECNALTGFCVSTFAFGGVPSDWYSNFGPGYGRLCPTCPPEPTHTLCCNQGCGPGPTPSYGIPVNYPNLVVPPGATCAEWCACSGPFTEWRHDVDNDPTFAPDCNQCVDWCNPGDCSYVLTGRNLTGTLVECNGCNPLP